MSYNITSADFAEHGFFHRPSSLDGELTPCAGACELGEGQTNGRNPNVKQDHEPPP